MKVRNFLPLLLGALKRWPTLPSRAEFQDGYLSTIEPLIRPMVEDFEDRYWGGLYEVAEGLNWEGYRAEALKLDPEAEEARLRKITKQVERLLGVKLKADILLFGAFTAIDGYARFDRGSHRVYLGVDEHHGRGAYLDILIAHELTHVAREPMPEVWKGFGLDPKALTHDQFLAKTPVVEHVFSEGYSCVVSELLFPGHDPWTYVYLSKEDFGRIMAHGPAVDRAVHAALADPAATYRPLYEPRTYTPQMPRYAHYLWAWLWVKRLLAEQAGGDPRKLLARCAKEFADDALAFKMPKTL